jgi:hypothetical protein
MVENQIIAKYLGVWRGAKSCGSSRIQTTEQQPKKLSKGPILFQSHEYKNVPVVQEEYCSYILLAAA